MQIQFCTTIVTFCTPEAKNSDRIANILSYSLMWYHMGPLGRTKKGKRIWQPKDHISLQNILFQNTSDSTYIQCNEYIRIYEKWQMHHFIFVTLLFVWSWTGNFVNNAFFFFSKKKKVAVCEKRPITENV